MSMNKASGSYVGFKTVTALTCLWSLCYVCRNAEKILGFLGSGVLSKELIPPHINFSHLTTEDYAEMYGVIKAVKEDGFSQLGLDPCVLEDELNKVSDGDDRSTQVYLLTEVFYVLNPSFHWSHCSRH